jgi:hypothetical protein
VDDAVRGERCFRVERAVPVEGWETLAMDDQQAPSSEIPPSRRMRHLWGFGLDAELVP